MPNNPAADPIRAYASYGGGVNSTAMILLIMEDKRFADLRDGLRIAFADTGAELPETLCYVRYFGKFLRERYGLEIETVSAGSLIDYCTEHRMVPHGRFRWCTERYKVKPLESWAREIGATVALVGIDAGEQHRVQGKQYPGVLPKRYPLIEKNMDRQECLEFISVLGLELPKKSGCWLCPFANKARYEDLLTRYPELFEQACQLEESAKGYEKGYYLKDKPLRQWIATPGFDFGEPCVVCELS